MRHLLLSLFFVLTACATGKYQPLSWDGGYYDQKVGKDVYYVSYSGNKQTTVTAAEAHVLRRSAEITLQAGFTHFALQPATRPVKAGSGTEVGDNLNEMMAKPIYETNIKMSNGTGYDAKNTLDLYTKKQ